MKNGLKRTLKSLGCMAMATILTLTGIQMPALTGNSNSTVAVASAASTTGRVPMWAYMKNSSGKLTTYTSNSLTKSTGYIVPGDYCKILNLYSNGAVRVSYPTSSGQRTAYAAMSGFMTSTGFSTGTRTLGKNLTAYRRSTGSATIGTVYANDKVLVIGTANGRTQVQYPCSGGYKLGWVSGNYTSTSSNQVSTVVNTYGTLASAQAKAITFNANYYANMYGDLKAAFGYNEASLYNHYLNYGIREGRSASPVFDPVYYLNNNADLKKAFGSNYTAAYNHWITYGYAEYRISSQYYNGTYYRNKYSDLRSMSSYNLVNHYLNYGINEKRHANSAGRIPNISNNNGNITSASLCSPVPAGCKFSKKSSDNGWYGCHDINRNVSTATPVYAIADGTIVCKQAYTDIKGVGIYLTSYGNFIEFTSNDNVYKAKYCHLNRFVNATQIISSGRTKRQGGRTGTHTLAIRKVKKGEIIGYIGTTGNSSGIHLHFELFKNGNRVEPTSVFNGLI